MTAKLASTTTSAHKSSSKIKPKSARATKKTQTKPAKIPMVSIILPLYNKEKYLRFCLESILAQDFTNWEMIVVDDGSTDNSLEILKTTVSADARVRFLTQTNQGAGVARNRGIDLAAGKYLWIVDGDDFFEANFLTEVLQKAESTQAELVVVKIDNYHEINDNFSAAAHTFRDDYLPPYEPFTHREITFNCFKTFVGWSWDKLFSREFVNNLNIRFQEIRSSNDLFFVYAALASAKKIATVPEILGHYRRESESSVSKTRDQHWQNFYIALTGLQDFLKQQNIWQEMQHQFIDYALHFSLWNLNTLSENSRRAAVQKLRGEWGGQLGIIGKPADYFFTPKEFDQYREYVK
jgi:glycosyltransferase involved in cell wall biosynthesis